MQEFLAISSESNNNPWFLFSILLLVELVDLLGKSRQGILSLLLLVLDFGLGGSSPEVVLVLFQLLCSSLTPGSAEDIDVLLVLEVDIVVSVGVREFSWVITIVIPSGVSSHVLWATISPVPDRQVTNRFALVVIAYDHSSLVGLVINNLCPKHPLSLLSEGLKDVVWAHFHDRDLLVEAGLFAILGSATLVLLDFSVATARDWIWLESHEL